VYRIGVEGELDVLTDRLPHFPNGCAVTPDGSHLWLVESRVPTVNRIDLASGEVEEISRLDATVPDGIAFTADGDAIVSCYRPDRIVRLGRDGSIEVVAEDPQGTLLAAPTNVVFVGARRDRLVSANLGRWHLTLLDVGLLGAPLHYPDRWAADA
jgi:gluconolactonase